MKNCVTCHKDLNLGMFFKNKHTKDGFNHQCKDCRKNWNNNNKSSIEKYLIKTKNKKKEYDIIYRKENQEKIQEYAKQNRNKPEFKENYRIYRKKYQEDNIEFIREYNRELKKRQWREDLNFRIKVTLRQRLWETLNRIKANKFKSSLILLGCSIEEFKNYIESLFKPEMNWQNHGKVWEIDHIIGCCNFDLTKEEEQHKCFHYINLQPLFKTSKIAKQYGYEEIGNRNKSKIFKEND